MKSKLLISLFSIGLLLSVVPAARGEVVWHDPWLNWDFLNNLGIMVNDFAIIVDSPNWVPQEQWAAPFPNFATSAYDWDGDGVADDTMCKWTGANVNPNEIAHGGLYMVGSGLVLDAFWTLDCNKVGWSTPITYEMTEIRGDPEVHMHLTIAPGFFQDENHPDSPYQEAGWTHIRTFVNIPADLLGLEDLNRSLDLDALAQMDYEVQPKDGETGLPIAYDDIIWGQPDSFFDVYLDVIPPEYASPEYEALLHAEVVNQGQVVGEFWNLNPQSPEPATLGLLAVGALALIRRRRRA